MAGTMQPSTSTHANAPQQDKGTESIPANSTPVTTPNSAVETGFRNEPHLQQAECKDIESNETSNRALPPHKRPPKHPAPAQKQSDPHQPVDETEALPSYSTPLAAPDTAAESVFLNVVGSNQRYSTNDKTTKRSS